MKIIPAIDIKDSKVVRLTKGDFKKSKIYSDYPEEVALRWQEKGARYLHLQIIFLLLFLILLRLLLKDKRDWRKFMWVIVVAAVLMILYGVGAGLKYIDADTQIITVGGEERVILSGTGGPLYQTFNGFIGDSFSREGYRFQGSIGNSSYVAVYLIFASFFASYLFITSNRSRELLRYVLALSIMFFIFFFFLAATRGAFVGLGLAIAAGILYLIFSNKKYRKPLLVFIIVMVLLFSVGFYFRDNPGLQKIPGSRIFDISIGTKTFQDRLIMWNIAWEGFKERPIFGWGPENYDEVFFRKYNTDYYNPGEGYGAWFDRAHNLFFDYLVETGIVGAVAYTAIFVIFFWLFFKKIGRNNKKASENDNRRAAGNGQSGLLTKNRKALINAMILVVPVAYLIQGLVLFEVLVIYMQLYIFLAFFDWKINGPEYKVQN